VLGFIAYLMLLGLLAVGLTVAAVTTLSRVAARAHLRAALASGALFVLGTVPPSVLAVLWWARSADYRWAIRGPGIFAHLGGGPAMLALFVITGVWTVGCWSAALWLAVRGARREGV
jgi:hypothetical protein